MEEYLEKYLAPIKTKRDFFLKLNTRIVKSEYTMNFMEDRNGRKAMFYNYKGEEFEEGDCILLTATVARHDVREWKNETYPQTYLNRVIVKKNMGIKKETETKI
tara:strand:+ start:159 stop:470 length:312 start_codon:yes stop_codon:yes gene_type:complete